jgi:hypothetical protein
MVDAACPSLFCNVACCCHCHLRHPHRSPAESPAGAGAAVLPDSDADGFCIAGGEPTCTHCTGMPLPVPGDAATASDADPLGGGAGVLPGVPKARPGHGGQCQWCFQVGHAVYEKPSESFINAEELSWNQHPRVAVGRTFVAYPIGPIQLPVATPTSTYLEAPSWAGSVTPSAGGSVCSNPSASGEKPSPASTSSSTSCCSVTGSRHASVSSGCRCQWQNQCYLQRQNFKAGSCQ